MALDQLEESRRLHQRYVDSQSSLELDSAFDLDPDDVEELLALDLQDIPMVVDLEIEAVGLDTFQVAG